MNVVEICYICSAGGGPEMEPPVPLYYFHKTGLLMNRRFCFYLATLLLLGFSIQTLEAKVKIEKVSKVAVARFYIDNYDSVTIQMVEQDFVDALQKAHTMKVNTFMLYSNSGSPFFIIKGKEEMLQVDKHLSELKKKIDDMTTRDFKQGEVKSSRQVLASGAKYRSETYLNGRLTDTYESDWDAGYFKPSTSTYKSSSGTYVTKTFYVAPKYKTEYTYEKGTTTTIEGIYHFARKIYILE